MTVSSRVSSIIYVGDGSTTVFDVPFRFLEDSDLQLSIQATDGTVTNLVLNSDYTVSGANADNGGKVNLTHPVGNQAKLSILRVMDLLQETDYRENERFPAESHERALDKLTFEVQQLQEQSDRAIKVDVFSDVDPDVLRQHIERVWDSVDNIDIVANDKANMDTVALNIADVNTNANNMADIKTNATNINSIKTNANNVADINLLADNMTDINTNALNMQDINTTASISRDVSTVADIKDDVVVASQYSTVISTVANVADDVDILADVVPELRNLSPIKNDIVIVGQHTQAIEDIGENIELVLGAVPAAESALNSAAAAKQSELNAKQSEENAKVFGDIVRILSTPTQESPISTVNFGRKCESGSYLTVYVDRVKLYDGIDYTLAPDGMSITLTSPATYGHNVLCEYIIGIPSAMINEMREKVDDVLYERDITATGTLVNGTLVFDISSYKLDENKRYDFHLTYDNTGVTTSTPVQFSATNDNIVNKLVTVLSPDFTTDPTVGSLFQVTQTSGTTSKMIFTGVATRDGLNHRGILVYSTVNQMDTLNFYTKTEIDDIVDTLAPSSEVGAFVESTNRRLGALESADTAFGTRLDNDESVLSSHTSTLAEQANTNTSFQNQINAKAPSNSPVFTGTPTAPTAPTGTNNTQVATTSYVNNKVKYVTALPANPDPNVFYFIPE